MEFEICKLLGLYPKQVNEIRRENPDGLAFLEYYIIDDYNKQVKHAKKQNQQAKRRRKH